MEVTYILFCVVCLLMIENGQGNTFWEYKRLYRHLEENFDKTIRPVINQSKSIIVGIDFNLQAIQGLDEKEQVLQSSIALTCNWKYETLVWNESEFSEIKTMYISPVDAWIPDLIAGNSIDSLYVLTENRADMLQIKVESNGDAQWYTGGNIRTSCNVGITKYPFDVQHCTIVISKTTPDTEVHIDALRDQVIRVLYKENGEWALEKSIIEKRVIFGYTTFLDITLTLKRHSLFYVLNIIVPVFLLSFMIVLCFKIPVASGERISYSISLLLTFVVLLNLVSDSMPRVPKHISYLQIYISYQLTVAVVITSVSILLIRATHIHDDSLSSSLVSVYSQCYNLSKRRKLVTSRPVEAIEVNEDIRKTESPKHSNTDTKSKTVTRPGSPERRKFFVHHIDNLLFFVFVSLFVISTLLFMVLVLL
ncbi:neuronal acetylcholine receptor subunit beta-2-like [Ruditapes philippinarum]|uniref:neuronal acetylcholine receptor subunit beta-2-like n=1 Tax=Ruditapes philippinarum TaxID=129788 RepID=UPI00295BD465|nr:neuronal acetylcholine receptor subunit beta-2-like [Ruditapes philippinarum]